MKIIDLKPYGEGIYTEVLECNSKEILFETHKKIADKYYYCIIIYDINRDTTVEIYRYEVSENERYSQYTHLINDKIIIIKTHNQKKLEVDKINRKDGGDKKSYFINTKEDITSIPIFINEHYLLFYTDIDRSSVEYERYVNSGYEEDDHAIYLYDLYENEIYFVKDFRVIIGINVDHGRIGKLPTFLHKNEEYLIVSETYMDDWEYEELYEYALDGELDKSEIDSEALYFIKVDEFINSIKSGEENIPFKIINKKDLDGWIRYFYSDENYIYYRDKDFKTQKEKIIKMDKDNLEPIIVKEIDHSMIKGRIMYDNFSETCRIYEEYNEEKGNNIITIIKGHYNCDYNVDFSYNKFQEGHRGTYSFFEFIKDRYIIASGWYEDEEENYFDIYYIMDLEEGKGSRFTGSCKVYENNLIIYESTLL